MNVGPYAGGSIQAQVLIIFDEYAHDQGLIPDDNAIMGNSMANTATVLAACAGAINGIGGGN